ncbi:Sperm flagellar protein 2 [Phytophthora ramorum]|uniref:Sperm flagellar protein 2 n=1 Tax=Phytophthora ramorum TaxID=164328 RepID=UPI00309DE763|nr:Sperm flagellar protein 2 [Phytophthora ramorum]
MADLLLRWLNHELELSTHVTDVEADFASGYLLGEILHRLNHQHNFADFIRSSSADAKILNFCLLEPSLRNLNIKFDANTAAAVMNEKRDAAANLLYQIKIAATRLGRAPGVSTKSLERTAIIPLHNRPVKLAKPAYDVENHRQFEHSVRRHVRSIASLQQEKGRIAEEATKRQAYLARKAEHGALLETTKAERLHRAFIHSSYIKEALEETDSPAWRLALQKKNAWEQRRAAFFQQLMQKREEAEEHLTFSLRRKVKCDLDDFDGRGGSKPVATGGKVSSRKSVGYGLRSLTTALGAASDKKKYSTSNLAGSSMNERELYRANVMEMENASGVIKQQRHQRDKRKENFSRRRKRFVQECVYTHSRIGTARVASVLEDAVVRETNSEKDIQDEMSRILVYKEVARENRAMRSQEYVNQQELDSVAAIDRDTSCYHNFLLEFEDDSEMQMIQRNNAQVSVESADRFLSEQISAAIMKDMVEFVLFIAGRREETLHSRDPAVFLTSETWNEYKVQFSHSCNLANVPSHKAWHATFHTLYEPASTGMSASEVQEAIKTIVDERQKEKQEEAESKQQQQEASEQTLMVSEEERHRHIDTFEVEIDEAKQVVVNAEVSVAEAEEAKAKKEEILELRQKLEEAQRLLDGVMTDAKGWVVEEQSRRPLPSSNYSGELVPATAHALAAMWNDMEVEYISTMKTSFALLREQRHRTTERARLMTSEFCEFIRRPDQKQEIVNLFQKLFNEVVDEMRFDDLTKLELHARADVLQDELGALVEANSADNDEELNSMVGDGWTEDTCRRVAAIYQMALQAECDRFRISVQLLVDAHHTASGDRSEMSNIVEAWQVHQSRLELACSIYRDPSNDTPPEAPSAPVATGKATQKGKAKASVPAVVPQASTATSNDDALTESLTMNELLAEYGHVLQRCGSWMDAIAPFAIAAAESSAGNSHAGDFCKINLLRGIKYEHDLMQRRVRFLQESTEKSCDEITRSMRSVEITLRDVLEDRKGREQVAIAALVEHIRVSIEAEVALPSFIDISPEFTQRFPTTMQLCEDTMVRVDGARRLLPRTSPDAPPIVEETHVLLLNPRQCALLREAFASQTTDDSGLLPLCTLVETMAALTSLSDALPDVWRRCPAHVIAEIAAGFTMKQSAFVDIEALLTAMSTRDDLLRQFQEAEALEVQHQQEEQEHQLFLQQQQVINAVE